ncbi:MAG: hypothetical protein M5U26_12415 [Planctomycetota bacterium]|nr:hypothetical protein [Planctomycetota bacterium]
MVGDGMEDELVPAPVKPPELVTPGIPAPPRVVRTTDEPRPPLGAERPLKVLPSEDEPVSPVPLALPGPESRPRESLADPLDVDLPAPAQLPNDLTADLPTATAERRKGPFWVELEDFKPEGVLTAKEDQAYRVLSDMKKTVYQISEDLDSGGKERTRLIYNAEALGKQVNILAETWRNSANFRDHCMSAKRSALVLEEELRNEPRKWSHVRWAFQAVQHEIGRLRRATMDQIKGTSRPITIVTQDGREIVVEAPQDTPETLAQKEAEARREAAERQKELLIKQAETTSRQKAEEIDAP